MTDEVTPHTREDRLPRADHRWKPYAAHVGTATMPETCPRCGWPCTHLVTLYYPSPWNDYGGMCSMCCGEAVQHFDRVGWPADPLAKAGRATYAVFEAALDLLRAAFFRGQPEPEIAPEPPRPEPPAPPPGFFDGDP